MTAQLIFQHWIEKNYTHRAFKAIATAWLEYQKAAADSIMVASEGEIYALGSRKIA